MRPRPLPAGEAKKEARMISTLGSLLIGTILPFLVVLTVVVFVHELGHFLVARGVGVAVRTFSLGFGPELFGRDDAKGTRWRLSAVPLGGYVKFVDDANAASVPDFEAPPVAVSAANPWRPALPWWRRGPWPISCSPLPCWPACSWPSAAP